MHVARSTTELMLMSKLLMLASGAGIAGVQAFGSSDGLAQFCFDDLTGIEATGLHTCEQVRQQGYCANESYTKFCHKTCLVCTEAPTPYPTQRPTPRPTPFPTRLACKDHDEALTRMLIKGGKKDTDGLRHPCKSVKIAGFCHTHTALSKKYCPKMCGLCPSSSACASRPCVSQRRHVRRNGIGRQLSAQGAGRAVLVHVRPGLLGDGLCDHGERRCVVNL